MGLIEKYKLLVDRKREGLRLLEELPEEQQEVMEAYKKEIWEDIANLENLIRERQD